MTMSLARRTAKLAFAGVDRFLPNPPGPRVLIYHQVGAGLGRQMEVTEADFDRQLDWLAEHRQVVDLETAIGRWDAPDSDRLVVLTFDDGFADVHDVAFPRLLRRNMPFTLYLTTGPIDTGAPLGGVADAPPLDWGQVDAMLASGLVTIGAHTHTHPDLRSLATGEIERELATSDDLIERRTGVRPRHFTYPWGHWTKEAHALVAQRYDSATVGLRLDRQVSPDRFVLPRFPVQLSDGFRFFPARLRGGLLAEEWVRRRLRGYAGP